MLLESDLIKSHLFKPQIETICAWSCGSLRNKIQVIDTTLDRPYLTNTPKTHLHLIPQTWPRSQSSLCDIWLATWQLVHRLPLSLSPERNCLYLLSADIVHVYIPLFKTTDCESLFFSPRVTNEGKELELFKQWPGRRWEIN